MGVPPFQSNDDFDLIEMHLSAPPPPLAPDVPVALGPVIARALAKHQTERFPDALAMAAAIEAAAKEIP